MTRRERSASRRTGNDAADPLDEALRQIGSEMLDEPVPERLRQILRQALRGAGEERDSSEDEGRRGSERQ